MIAEVSDDPITDPIGSLTAQYHHRRCRSHSTHHRRASEPRAGRWSVRTPQGPAGRRTRGSGVRSILLRSPEHRPARRAEEEIH